MQFKPQEKLTEQVAQHIENMIVFEQLKCNQRIYEAPMAKDLSVSHGSIREALLMLEGRHLVRCIPRKGTFVTELDEHFVKSLYEVMLLYLKHTGIKLLKQWKPSDMERLESLYSQMNECLTKGDLMKFLDLGIVYTQTSLAYADNYFIVNAINDLWPSAKRCAFVAFKKGNNVLKDNLQQMRESIDAIKDHDEQRLIDILDFYANQQCNQVLESLGNGPQEAHI